MSEIWNRAEIDSPCVKICVIHPQARICIGCYRTGDEIAAWSRLTDEARASVMQDLPARAPLLAQRRGGRSARLGQD
jgi:predicted Fe-S protein YdhL (DUF1289 family)